MAEFRPETCDDEGDDDITPSAQGFYFKSHVYCSVCGHDWDAYYTAPPSQQGFLECPDCGCWTRLNLIDDSLRQ